MSLDGVTLSESSNHFQNVEIYNEEIGDHLKVKHPYFHKIFSWYFNLGFGSPATNVSSYYHRAK